jgi:hypothetical protein
MTDLWPAWESSNPPKDRWLIARRGLSWQTTRAIWDPNRESGFATAISDRIFGQYVDPDGQVVVISNWHPEGEARDIPPYVPPKLETVGGFVVANGAEIARERYTELFSAITSAAR